MQSARAAKRCDFGDVKNKNVRDRLEIDILDKAEVANDVRFNPRTRQMDV